MVVELLLSVGTAMLGYTPTLRHHYMEKGISLAIISEHKKKDCYLLPTFERTIRVQRAKSGYMGRSNIWFANDPRASKFRRKVIDFIVKYRRPLKSDSRKFVVDKEIKNEVKRAAINATSNYYESYGYDVTSRVQDNVGWDLDVEAGDTYLSIVVKGLAQNEIEFAITTDEFAQMYNTEKRQLNTNYRICVVTQALASHPEIHVFKPKGDIWICQEDDQLKLKIDEKIAAVAFAAIDYEVPATPLKELKIDEKLIRRMSRMLEDPFAAIGSYFPFEVISWSGKQTCNLRLMHFKTKAFCKVPAHTDLKIGSIINGRIIEYLRDKEILVVSLS